MLSPCALESFLKSYRNESVCQGLVFELTTGSCMGPQARINGNMIDIHKCKSTIIRPKDLASFKTLLFLPFPSVLVKVCQAEHGRSGIPVFSP